jgi:hypothetical protein
MKFSKNAVFIDPSYTCTGCLFVKDQVLTFNGFTRSETKRDLNRYFLAATDIAKSLESWLYQIIRDENLTQLDIVLEAPFPGSFASSGLYLLQGLILKTVDTVIRDFPLYKIKLYSLSPSFISGQIKKHNNKKDSISIRKKWAEKLLHDIKEFGFVVTNPEELKLAGADRQTALGFWWFLRNSDKELEPFEFL